MDVGKSFAAYTAHLLGYLLLVPFFVLVLHVALQRWRSATTTATGHMDVLTYHMVLLELLSLVGVIIYYSTSLTGKVHKWGTVLTAISCIGIGKSLFHLLACLDRYLAVVHPIRYVWTRQSAGIRFRNVFIGCAWLLCLPSFAMNYVQRRTYAVCLLVFALLFSSGTLCVLFVIHRAGPKRESRDKRRALRTVAAITASLALRFLGNMIPAILLATLQFSLSQQCFLITASLPLSLPSSLVMPLLFLQRAGKLPNCQHTSISEREESS